MVGGALSTSFVDADEFFVSFVLAEVCSVSFVNADIFYCTDVVIVAATLARQLTAPLCG